MATGTGLELALDRAYVALSRMAADPTDFYHLPRDRVELGERVAILTSNGSTSSAAAT